MAASMTIVDAINEIVETVGEFPMAGATPPSGGGTSIYDRARNFLDRESKYVQSWGWPENTVVSKQYIADQSGDKTVIDTHATFLTLRASGSSAHRNLVARDDGGTLRVYDGNAGTFAFVANEKLYVDEVTALKVVANGGIASDSAWGFELATVPLQQAIVDQAKIKFQRRYQGSESAEVGLIQEAALSDIRVQRNQPDTTQPMNIQPMVPQSQQARREG
tara:strand:+ start:5180 stop:5839 length:660 start_codon:yes stop_codon:yes gene_type:complete